MLVPIQSRGFDECLVDDIEHEHFAIRWRRAIPCGIETISYVKQERSSISRKAVHVPARCFMKESPRRWKHDDFIHIDVSMKILWKIDNLDVSLVFVDFRRLINLEWRIQIHPAFVIVRAIFKRTISDVRVYLGRFLVFDANALTWLDQR